MIRVFPVCTGMNREAETTTNIIGGVPRMHGDEPLWITLTPMSH